MEKLKIEVQISPKKISSQSVMSPVSDASNMKKNPNPASSVFATGNITVCP